MPTVLSLDANDIVNSPFTLAIKDRINKSNVQSCLLEPWQNVLPLQFACCYAESARQSEKA
jgi:hypothetical protein